MTTSFYTTALYNEIEPYAADWLVNLERAGHIAPGRVDRRSVRELVAADVFGATQFHAFAGIGVWQYALRRAGWPDDRHVWTGSCPCQPFSSAGQRKGFADAKHLWPEWFRLIATCRPAIIFGEQVASPAGLAWFDVVAADLERVHWWQIFYANMHEVRSEASKGRLPQILWEILGWSTSDVSRLSEDLREKMATSSFGAVEVQAGQTSVEGARVSAGLRQRSSRALADQGDWTAGDEEKTSVRLGQIRRGNRAKSPAPKLRTDRSSAEFREQGDSVGLAIDRQDRSEGRLSVRQYSHCLFCNERCSWVVGAGYSNKGHGCLAGKEIANDERLLADAFRKLLASPAGLDWFDVVSADLEREGYAVGAADLCAAGAGAPHLRQRLYFMAYADEARRRKLRPRDDHDGDHAPRNDANRCSTNESMADAVSPRLPARELEELRGARRREEGGAVEQRGGSPWTDVEWLDCKDGKRRPAQPGIQPLATRHPGHVGQLRAYGNSLCAEVAVTFIRAAMEVLQE